MSLRIALLLGALLLPGCLDYVVTVEVTLAADGTVRRVIRIRERSNPPKTWELFRPPAKPYFLTGSEKEGFAARATFEPGRHPNGIAIQVERYEGEYKGARELAAAEGDFHVEVSDLMIGTLYAYRETIALGTDDAYFCRELVRWLETSWRVGIRALEIAMPEADFAPVKKRARETILPRWGYSIRAIRQAATGLVRDYREQRYGQNLAAWLANPSAKLILAELENLGLRRTQAPPTRGTLQDFVDDGFWKLEGGLLDELLEPLPVEKRARVKELLWTDDALDEEVEQAFKELFPEEADRTRFQEESLRLGVAGLGAYFLLGLFDEFDLRVRLTMPGRLLATNGGLDGQPTLEWRLTNTDLVIAAPQLTAYSFVPVQGLEKKVWHVAPLLALREKLNDLDEGGRAALGEVMKIGWTADKDDLEEAHGKEVAEAYQALRDALD
jgi:hypothetical protein